MLIVCAIALSIRVVSLENYPRWFVDEGSYAQLALNMLASHWGYQTRVNFFPPLFVAIEAISLRLLPANYLAARLPGALMGTLSCTLLYVLARRMTGRLQALSAALILAVSSAYVNRVALQDNALQLFLLLTVICFMNAGDQGTRRWWMLSGLMAGFAFLSKFTGVCAILFLVLQGALDRNLRKMKLAFLFFLASISIYPAIGAFIDWQTFLLETFTLQGTRYAINPYDLVFTLSVGAPASQLEIYPEVLRTPLQIFTFLGFLSTLVIVITGKAPVDRLVSTSVASVVITFAASQYVWWGFLSVLYPFYALSTSLLIFRLIAVRHVGLPDRSVILGFAAVVSVVLATILMALVDTSSESFKILFFTIFPVLLAGLIYSRTRAFLLLKHVPAILMISALLFASISQVQQVRMNQTADQAELVEFMNSHAGKSDLVAANPAVAWLLNSVGVNYAEVAFYTTREETFAYIPAQAEHFVMNVSLWNCKYIVLDTPWLRDKLGQSKSVEILTPVILSEWKEIYSVGDYHVYENPRTMVYRIEGTVTDGTGTPIVDAWVTCFNPITRVEYGSHTNSDGRYMFLTPSGIYIFDVWPPSGTKLMHYRDAHFQVASNVLNEIRFQPGVIVKGIVFASDGYTPVVDAWVSLHDDVNKVDYGAYTETHGAYTILAPEGTYIFDVWPPQGMRLMHYQDRNFTLTEDVTRTIVLRSGFVVAGYVLAPDRTTPVPGCWVSLYDPNTREVFGSWSDANGYYTFLAPSGTYILNVWPPGDSRYQHLKISGMTIQSDTHLDLNLTTS